MPVDISIIVPVYNEAENILPLAKEVAAALQPLTSTWELVFVDDASTDGTWDNIQATRKQDARVRGLQHQQNAGQSAALWTGIHATHSRIIVTLDGDRQNDPADIPALLKELNRYDFVCGARLKRQDNWLRKVSSKVARRARQAVLKADFKDTGCALRAFQRSTLDGVFPFNGWHRFLPILVHGTGARTLEVPVNHRPRVAGLSKYGMWNRLWRGLYDLVGVGWYQKRRLHPVPFKEADADK